jgi:protein-S-isoprenylcysteine O-methyltransferase Ste14
MALVHEFENSGNWLFKRRSWLPVVMVVAGIVMLYLGNRQAIFFDLRDEMIFLGVSIFGQIIRILTVGFTAKNTSGRNQTAGQIADGINTTGMYSIIRHPLYVGNFFMWLGPVLFLKSVWFTVVFILVYWLYYERIMFAEEQFLRRKFGEAYDKWSENVRAFFPFHVKFIRPNLPFSIRNVLKNEHNAFANIFVIFALLDLFRNYFLSSRKFFTEKIFLTKIWMWLLIGAVGLWIVVHSIHKYTKWLEVRER